MVNDGCLLGFKPIAEAMELNLKPLYLSETCLEGLLAEAPALGILGDLEDRDHQVREEAS